MDQLVVRHFEIDGLNFPSKKNTVIGGLGRRRKERRRSDYTTELKFTYRKITLELWSVKEKTDIKLEQIELETVVIVLNIISLNNLVHRGKTSWLDICKDEAKR